MSYGSPSRYREMEVLALSPARRVVLLYAQLQVALTQARTFLVSGEIEARTEALLRAESFVFELAASLDRAQGGELAERLATLYGWMLTQLTALHHSRDLATLDALRHTVAELHEAWEGAAQQVESTTSPLRVAS